jgi:hypothetical protein
MTQLCPFEVGIGRIPLEQSGLLRPEQEEEDDGDEIILAQIKTGVFLYNGKQQKTIHIRRQQIGINDGL